MKLSRPTIFRTAILTTTVSLFSLTVFIVELKPNQAYAGGSVCDTVTLESIQKHTPVPPAQIVSKKDVMGMCEVVLKIGTELYPLYATDKFVIAGEIFADRKQVTKDTMDKLKAVVDEDTKKRFSSIKSELDKYAGITYTPKGQIKQKLYMFGTPTCPHCVRAANELQPILDSTNTKLVFLLEGSGETRALSADAICKKLDLPTYNARKWITKDSSNESKMCEVGKEKVDKATSLAGQLGVRGVPTFFLEDGSQIVGANMPEIKRRLSTVN